MAGRVDRHGELRRGAVRTHNAQRSLASAVGVELLAEVGESHAGDGVDGRYAVALAQPGLLSRLSDDLVDDRRIAIVGKAILVAEQALHGVGGDGDGRLLSIAQHGDGARTDHLTQAVFVQALQWFIVGTEQDVAVAESDLAERLAELHAGRDVPERQVCVAPREEHHRVDEDGQEEVEEHAADHDQQSLPGRFGAELPRLRGLRHLLLVHRFVDHAGDLTVPAEGQPADAVFRVAVFGFEPEQGEPGVEEEVELLNAHLEEAGEEEMPELMHQHKNR